MMTSPARRVTGGVDTHSDVHVAAVVDSITNRELGVESFPTTAKGYACLLGWLYGYGEVDRVGVESTGSYGAGLTRFLRDEGVEVIEVDRPDRKARRFEGKSDPTDALAAARAVVSGRAASTPKSRDGLVEAVRALEVVHHGAVKDRTRAINQFKALLVSAPNSVRDSLRRLSFSEQLARARRLLDGHGDVVESEARWALKELARRIGFLDEQTARLECHLGEVPGLPGVELVLDRLAHPADGRLRQGRLGAESTGQAGLHIADRQAPDEPGDHQRLQRVGAAHADTEQPGGERLVGASQLGPVDLHWPGRGLDRGRTVPVAAALADPFAVAVALTAQKLGDLGLDRGLHQQAHPEAGHLLQHLAQLPLGTEQVVYPGADALDR